MYMSFFVMSIIFNFFTFHQIFMKDIFKLVVHDLHTQECICMYEFIYIFHYVPLYVFKLHPISLYIFKLYEDI